MQPATSFALRRSLSLFSKTRVVTYPHTLHEHARRQSTEPPHFTRSYAAPHASLSNGPSLSMFSPNQPKPDTPEETSDLEWEIRTGRPDSLLAHCMLSAKHGLYAQGRAIHILETTLPDFFQVGLVATVDATGPDIVDVAPSENGHVESIYSPAIRLMYTPPVALPPPFPRTLSLEGLALYMASSVFIRHTMKTLYSDLRVEMRKLVVHTPSPMASQTSPAVAMQSRKRDKSVCVGVSVYGTTRVSGGLGEWQIDSTYGFSEVSGMINLHRINSIQPAPHQAAYDALGASLSHIFGMGGDIRPGQVRAVNRDSQ